MNIKVISYEPVHAYEIIDRNIKTHDVRLTDNPDWKEFAENCKSGGPAYTLIIDGKIIFSAGVILLEWNKGEAWLLISNLFYRYKYTGFRLIKKYLAQIIETNKLRRVQALVAPEFESGKHFLTRLGFVEEADRLKAYGPDGEDFSMFGRIN